MLKKIKLLPALIILVFFSFKAFPQDAPHLDFGADIMSRYVWRGINLGGASPSIQPWLKYNVLKPDNDHQLSIGAWGAYTIAPTSNQELDLTLSYSYKNIVSISVSDYFFPEYFTNPTRNKYFNYNSDSTCHVLEGGISFNGTDKIPFTLFFGINFYGNDAKKIDQEGNTNKIAYSKYIELGYHASIDNIDFNAFIGASIDNPDEKIGEMGFYGNTNPGIINLGIKASKEIQLSDKFSLPVQASLVTNPDAEKIFLVFGFSF